MSRTIDTQRLRSLPIESVAERLGLKVSRHKCLCPYHNDSTPSLSFHLRRNTFRCFSCGAHGDGISLTMQVLGKSFVEACEWLDGGKTEFRKLETSEIRIQYSKPFDASRYAKFFEHPFINHEAARFLYADRHLDPRVINWCRLTSYRDKNGTPWLQIPYYDIDGKLIGVQNRNLSPLHLPRFRFPSGSQCHIYNLPILRHLKPNEPLFITEGCSDCWAMLSSGHKAIAIPSATLLKPKDLNILSTLTSQLSTPYHMYPDNDAPGERLFNQLSSLLPNLTRHSLPSGCKDFSDFYITNS